MYLFILNIKQVMYSFVYFPILIEWLVLISDGLWLDKYITGWAWRVTVLNKNTLTKG